METKKEDEIFHVLEKLMDDSVQTDASEARELFGEMQLLVDEKLSSAIERVPYERKYEVLTQVRDVCLDMSLYLYFPELVNQMIIGFHEPDGEDLKTIYEKLLRGRFTEETYGSLTQRFFDRIKGVSGSRGVAGSVPMIVHGQTDKEMVGVLNAAEKIVSLSDTEYQGLSDYAENQELDLAQLAYAVSVASQCAGNGQVYITIPKYADKTKKYYLSLKRAQDVLVLRGRDFHPQLLSEYANLSGVVVYGGISDADRRRLEEQCLERGISTAYPKSISKAFGILAKNQEYRQEKHNLCYSHWMQKILYEISWYLAVRLKQLESPMADINENLLYKDQTTEELLSKMRTEYWEKIDAVKQVYSDYQGVCDELAEKIEAIQEAEGITEQAEDKKTHLNMDIALLDLLIEKMEVFCAFPVQGAKGIIRSDCALYTERTGRRETASVLLEEFLGGTDYDRAALAVFGQTDLPSAFFQRKKIDLRGPLSLDIEACGRIISTLPKPLRSVEKKILGQYELGRSNMERAKDYLFEAMCEGDKEAGIVLVRNWDLSFEELCEAGDYGIATAAYQAGAALYEKVKNNGGSMDKCLLYLHIAAAGDDKQAQELLGDIFYQRFLDSKRNKEKYARAAVYYYEIVQKGGGLERSMKTRMERLGCLYFMLMDYKAAVTYSEQADTASSNYLLGGIYERGDGCAADVKKALRYYENAMNKGHTEASVAYERLNAKIEEQKKKNVVSNGTSYSSYSYYGGYYYSSGW